MNSLRAILFLGFEHALTAERYRSPRAL